MRAMREAVRVCVGRVLLRRLRPRPLRRVAHSSPRPVPNHLRSCADECAAVAQARRGIGRREGLCCAACCAGRGGSQLRAAHYALLPRVTQHFCDICGACSAACRGIGSGASAQRDWAPTAAATTSTAATATSTVAGATPTAAAAPSTAAAATPTAATTPTAAATLLLLPPSLLLLLSPLLLLPPLLILPPPLLLIPPSLLLLPRLLSFFLFHSNLFFLFPRRAIRPSDPAPPSAPAGARACPTLPCAAPRLGTGTTPPQPPLLAPAQPLLVPALYLLPYLCPCPCPRPCPRLPQRPCRYSYCRGYFYCRRR